MNMSNKIVSVIQALIIILLIYVLLTKLFSPRRKNACTSNTGICEH